MKNLLAACTILFLLTISAQAQEPALRSFPKGIYFDLAAGTNVAQFRDFATSPLFYKGPVSSGAFSYLKKSRALDVSLGFNASMGTVLASVDGFDVSSSLLRSAQIHYSRMYRLPTFSNDNWNVKAGGQLNTLLNIRQNPELRNNQIGFEGIFTLFGSAQVSRDLSRDRRKVTEFWFIRYTLPPRIRTLSYRLNLAVINSTYRNDFIYTNQSNLVNSDNYFDDYVFKVFSGYRLNAALNYTLYLKNRNAFVFSYEWDALTTGGELDKFEMANHILKFSLLFNLR